MAGDDVLEAVGGELGGMDRPSGQRVVVRLDGPCLDVFHETGVERFHATMLESVELTEHTSEIGTALAVTSIRRGINIPVRFEGAELERLDRIMARVQDYIGDS